MSTELQWSSQPINNVASQGASVHGLNHSGASSAPVFEPELWNLFEVSTEIENTLEFNSIEDLKVVNGDRCYEYAVSGKTRIKDLMPANPGHAAGIIAKITDVDNEGVVKLAQLDGLTPAGSLNKSTALPAPKDGYYLVALYRPTDAHDFHWIRQDNEGGWSEKSGQAEVRKVFAGEYTGGPHDIEVLAPPKLHYEKANKKLEYEFVSYFYVPEQGLDVGYDRYVENLVSKGDIGQAQVAHKKLVEILSSKNENGFSRFTSYMQSLNPVTLSALQHTPKELAEAFGNAAKNRNAVLREYPELDLAYQTKDSLDAKVDAHMAGSSAEQINLAKQLINKNILEKIAQGTIPRLQDNLPEKVSVVEATLSSQR